MGGVASSAFGEDEDAVRATLAAEGWERVPLTREEEEQLIEELNRETLDDESVHALGHLDAIHRMLVVDLAPDHPVTEAAVEHLLKVREFVYSRGLTGRRG